MLRLVKTLACANANSQGSAATLGCNFQKVPNKDTLQKELLQRQTPQQTTFYLLLDAESPRRIVYNKNHNFLPTEIPNSLLFSLDALLA